MHLLALGAFWPAKAGTPTRFPPCSGLNTPFGTRCFVTATNDKGDSVELDLSQCTFWRSVLSDPIKTADVVISPHVS